MIGILSMDSLCLYSKRTIIKKVFRVSENTLTNYMRNLCVPFLFIVPDLIGLGKMRYKLRSSKQPRLSEPRHINSLSIEKGRAVLYRDFVPFLLRCVDAVHH
jgi:hypothetical protein